MFLIAVFLAEGRLRWWLIAATILSLFLGWGKNFPAFNDAMFNYFPLYNKFRTVMMALIIACLAMPLLAFIMLDKLLRKENVIPDPLKITGLKYAAIAAGVISIFVLVPTLLFNMTSPRELELMAQNSGDTDLSGLIAALKQDRISMIRMDGVHIIFYWYCSCDDMVLYKNKINKIWVIAVIGILSVVDLWTTGRTYLTDENYGDSNYYEQYFYRRCRK
ncbi:MAG: hypothetical protein IPL48_16020 [Bacteroidetes bacterium]|nr:hypothetical protein [Bacteroidota bacterium]